MEGSGLERWEAALDRLLELTVLLSRDAADGLAGMGLTESRAHVLWELQHRGPSTQRVLADALQVTPRTVTTLVDALVETGFVTREPHPSDRRATLVTLTLQGQETAREFVEGHQDLARELLADLPDETFAGFEAGLAHVLERLHSLPSAT